MANAEVKNKPLNWYENVKKIAFGGALGFAVVAAFVAPELVVPALFIAGAEVGGIYLIDKFNKKKQVPKEQVIFQASAA